MKRLVAFFKHPPAWFALLWVLLTGGLVALSALVSSSPQERVPYSAVLYGLSALALSYAYIRSGRWRRLKI